MKPIHSSGHQIHFESGLKPLLDLLGSNTYSKIFVLTDINTTEHCLPLFRQMLDDFNGFDLIETDPGEENKNIDFCIGIWKTLLDFGADRKSLLINLGGGVITDMGGFVASTYKRGIDFVNIPTTLLSQVDASVGGKTGIDIDNVKNMVGTFSLPQAVFIETAFLKTVPAREMLSGYSEMLKHGLIADKAYFDELKNQKPASVTAAQIYRSVEIKNEVVTADPREKGLRKILNYGHTIGHAIESYFLAEGKNPLTHGEAIAAGMICEAWLSLEHETFTQQHLEEVTRAFSVLYPHSRLPQAAFDELILLMQSDKKNEDGKILFSTLEEPGKCTYNHAAGADRIIAAFNYYNQLF
ncbi:3-dehydroquinate synthase [Pedobacter yulinensis]|uniref:3-dehydroquinate synthase n=1 Tax=Pedobacter yulinensis TaxID=2126353 RepID=A0A2T3HMP4_9SPHI|nr:3-dehydroquinate synthase [Pedobacter yulinensis]PST83715.1 3-dehydroquinate synthase [Pedobacter yulinensis]